MKACQFSIGVLFLLSACTGCDRRSTGDAGTPATSTTAGTHGEVAPSASNGEMPNGQQASQAATAGAAPVDSSIDLPGTVKALPANITLPGDAVMLMSVPSAKGHFVQAQFPKEADQQKLISRLTEELAQHGWTSVGESESRVDDSLSADFENDTERLTLSVYPKPEKSGLFLQIQTKTKM
jgi:hypothetical protein